MASRKELAAAIIQDIVRLAKKLGHTPSRDEYEASKPKFTKHQIESAFGSWVTATRAAGLDRRGAHKQAQEVEFVRKARIGILDIETAPLLVNVFSLKHNDFIPPKHIKKDTCVLSWTWKWLGEEKLIYMDQRNAKDVRDDKAILIPLRDLLSEADAIITKNGKRFDQKFVFARMAINEILPPSPFKHEDLEQLLRKHFLLPSYSIEYAAKVFKLKHQKSEHPKFPGIKLWTECLEGNLEAWKEMEAYNKLDVLATEELRPHIIKWGTNVNYNIFHSEAIFRCQCGSTDLMHKGEAATDAGMFRQFVCRSCGAWSRAKGQGNNLFSNKKKRSLKNPISS